VSALQRRSSRQTLVVGSAEEAQRARSAAGEGCHDVTEEDGGSCWASMMWIKYTGLVQHPDWYPGLKPATATPGQLQLEAYNSTHPKCPRPCSLPAKKLWCQNSVAPQLWSPSAAGPPVEVKVLSYNLFWWHLFKIEGGRGDSAGHVIQDSMVTTPFDVMGFQECEDPERVLGPVGLLNYYTTFQGSHAICMAYFTQAWALLERGEVDVAEDMRTEFYGKRGVQWMRLQHRETGRTLLFMNHHGPLSVNSGGECGGRATANNLLGVMASKGQVGDLLVLVGDFNANAGSRTIQGLWPHLQQVFNGDSFGGVDNIFSNVPNSAVLAIKVLPGGGSDHDALSATVRSGPAPPDAPLPDLEAELCHTAVEGDACWTEVQWAMTQGIHEHPEWYVGLTDSSSSDQFQEKVHEETPSKCPMPCAGDAGKASGGHQAPAEPAAGAEPAAPPARRAAPRSPASGEIPTEGLVEPSQALENLKKAKGSDGCLIEPLLQYVVVGGWTEKLPGIADPRVCCRRCQGHGGCTSWTWTDWATEARGAECQLHVHGHVVNKVVKDGFVSGLPKEQAVKEAARVASVS